MNDDLHNIDDLFLNAYNQLEESPSATAWDQINAKLDNKDAEKYKRSFLGWKRIAILLLLLLSGLIIYEFRGDGVKTGNRRLVEENKTTVKKERIENSDKPVSGDANDKSQTVVKHENEISPAIGNGDIQSPAVSRVSGLKSPPINKTISGSPTEKITEAGNELVVNQGKSRYNDRRVYSSTAENTVKVVNGSAEQPVERTATKLPDIRQTALNMRIPVSIPLNNPLKNIVENKIPAIIGGRAALVPLALNSMKLPLIHKKQNWSLAAFFSNDWSMYLLNDDLEDRNNPQHERNEISSHEKHENSYAASLFLTRQFAGPVILKAGIQFANTAIGINPQYLYAAKQSGGDIAYKYNTSSGYSYLKPAFNAYPAVGDSLLSGETQHNLQSVSLQLMSGYKFAWNRFSLTASAGLTASYITRAALRTEVEDNTHREFISINRLYGTRKFFAGLVADVNLQYVLSQRWSVNVLPSFRLACTPITQNNVVKTYPYSFGLGLGLSYSL